MFNLFLSIIISHISQITTNALHFIPILKFSLFLWTILEFLGPYKMFICPTFFFKSGIYYRRESTDLGELVLVQ